jgi:penicillin-binding protein 1A
MVTLKWGLSRSNNHVSAWLMNQLSSKQLVNLMHLMGINNNAIHPSLALCLGPCDVGVGEMVSAYTSFANGGVRTAPLLVTKIEDADGNVVASFTPRVNVVISANSSYKMIDMMRAVINEGTGRRLRSHYKFTADICGKTGTTNNNSDAWFIGYTPSLVTGVWVGGEERDIHFNSMTYGQGAAASLPVWGIYMQKVYANKELGYSQDEKFVFPEGFEVCINESLEGLSNSESVIYERKRKNKPVEEKEEEATPGEFDEMFQ